MKTARQDKWIETLDLGNRSKPDLFLSPEDVIGVPHAAAMRIGFNKLELAGFFCVDSIPAIAFLTQDRLNRFKINITHKALWNQGLVSLLLVILPEEVRAYSLLQTPKPEDTADETDDIRDKRLIRSFNLAADAIELSHLITGVESGRYFQENKNNFDQKKKVDAELLSNLRETERRLNRLSPEAAQALLLQITFIAYLEDRGIIDHDYFKQAVVGRKKIGCLKDLLNSQDPMLLDALFKKLYDIFNGDIFFAPCSFDASAPAPPLTAEHLQHLAEFREGNVELATGQGRFWPYDFHYIPVELISAIYNRFLSERPKEQRASGAYYTPHFLADLTVNQIWENLPLEIRTKPDFRVLDPACGSAIFLVRFFQRIVEDWRSNNLNATPDWDTLVSIIKRLHGWDKEPSAVRIGIFSLYIALLEEVDPAAILKLRAERKLLPPLFRKTMCDRDFFAENAVEEKFDIVVGNPPWVSRKKEKVSSALTWCAVRNLPMPADELAWAFVWKGLHHVKPDGTIAFLLPAMGFLLNHSKPSIEARRKWLEQIFLKRVIKFSDICFLLFDGANRPTALCIFQAADTRPSDYRFDYWCPKADPLLQTTRMLTLNRGDKVSLKISTVLNNPSAWGRYLWMTGRDMKLLGWLSGLTKLDQKLSKYNENKKKEKPWIIGQGFQPVTNASDKPKPSNYVNKLKFLNANNFPGWVIPYEILSDPWHTSTVRRLGFEAGFYGPHVLIPKGIVRNRGLLRAAYAEEDFCFRHAIQAISFPQKDSSRLKLLTTILNSRFAAWFYFHETASFGSDRALVDEHQLLLLPFPDIDELPDPKAAQKAENAIVEVMDALLRDKDKYSQGQFPNNKTVEKLNQLVYQYYGFTEAEITIIEDTIRYILPSIQPRAKKIPSLWEKAGGKHCQEYVTTLTATLADWLKPSNYLSATLISDHPDLAVVGLKIQTTPPKQSFIITETAQAFKEALTRINKELKQQISPNFHLIPDLRIFIDDTLYLIKPKALRYWIKSAALNDADAVIADLQSLRYRGHKDKNR
jgi:hypothetical protein